MKHNDIPNISIKLTPQNYENIFNVYQDDSEFYFYNIIRTVNFPDELDSSVFEIYTTVFEDTWPLIAWKFYENVKLWWIVCAANQIINPVESPIPGTELKIINNVIVKNILNNLE